MLTVLTDSLASDHNFNDSVYCHHLNTRVLGNVILYADVTTTTMSLLQGSVLMIQLSDQLRLASLRGR